MQLNSKLLTDRPLWNLNCITEIKIYYYFIEIYIIIWNQSQKITFGSKTVQKKKLLVILKYEMETSSCKKIKCFIKRNNNTYVVSNIETLVMQMWLKIMINKPAGQCWTNDSHWT